MTVASSSVLAFTSELQVRRSHWSFRGCEFILSLIRAHITAREVVSPPFEDVYIRKLRQPGHPESASNMTTWVNSQFPRPDFHRQVQRHYGLRNSVSTPCPRLPASFPELGCNSPCSLCCACSTNWRSRPRKKIWCLGIRDCDYANRNRFRACGGNSGRRPIAGDLHGGLIIYWLRLRCGADPNADFVTTWSGGHGRLAGTDRTSVSLAPLFGIATVVGIIDTKLRHPHWVLASEPGLPSKLQTDDIRRHPNRRPKRCEPIKSLCVPRTSPFAPSPHRGHRPAGTWFAKGLKSTLFLLSGAVFAPRAAKADITYTWIEDDGQNITGSMTVQFLAVQAAGQIQFSDVTLFNFNFDKVPEGSFPSSSLTTNNFPLPISPLDASPTATTISDSHLIAEKSNRNPLLRLSNLTRFGIHPPDSSLRHSTSWRLNVVLVTGSSLCLPGGGGARALNRRRSDVGCRSLPRLRLVPPPPGQRRQRPVGPPDATQ